ncbi:hypothetical protein [Burkholderia pyrrocinia]|uniref:hypothetical protein n=1 Tax=Burkholderia pyrrocinia TaxID=60550 RepID=UPI001FC8B0AB|nr:hypothetical protein [Burkholderia pyrrocinia]
MVSKRKVRTKEMLLPLPAAAVRDISLENHLALVTMRTGHGTADTMIALLRILYMTFYVLGKDRTDADLALFLEVEAALDESIQVAGAGRDWRLPAERLPAIGLVLLRCDETVANVPKYRYVEAWEKLNAFVRSARKSPLPGSRLKEVWA